MRILLTGVAGFIGYHVAEALLGRGEEVVGIDNLNDYYDVQLKRDRLRRVEGHPAFVFHHCDVADQAAMDGVFTGTGFDVVCHLAAQAGVRYSLENPRAYGHSNLTGFLEILEHCRHGQVGRLVYASSSSVYGANEKVPFAVEDRVDRPVSLYAATKVANELMAHTYHHLYNLPVTGLRFFTVYGPWGRPDMALYTFTRKILAGEPIDVYNHGRMERDFTYIDDIVAGVLAAIDRPLGAAVVNLGNSASENLEQFIEVLGRALGRTPEKRYLPMQPGDVPRTYADVERTRQLLDWGPTTPIEVGIPRFVEWYRSYHDV